MKLKEFRELTADMRRLVNDWHACVDESERQLWRDRAYRFFPAFTSATSPRASSRDLENRLEAYRDCLGLLAIQRARVAIRDQAAMPRTSRYNKSPARAVRLSRAARGAMRRGYF
ncbi:hypothetical protein [Pseudomonas sp. EMN2]|uniref:hypothetical protein n=1 Tax=Pseudomonas sp. EMN2 TaxID=2615212 RepID=UPI00129B7092|nr:hypothetical protein [Pseudomonas sp. EMN2]